MIRSNCQANSLKYVALITMLVGNILLAQSFQTSFAEQKYDRVARTGTLHGGVQIDGASGALNMNLALGLGIGARGAGFRPELALRWAPQVTTVVHQIIDPNKNIYWASPICGESMASLSPGSLELLISHYPGPAFVQNYEVSGGPSGVIAPKGGQLPTPAPDTNGILAAFGYSSYQVVLNPHEEPLNPGTTPPTPFVRLTSDGGLLLGIASESCPQLVRRMNIYGKQTKNFRFPGRLLLVKGEIAYEFSFSDYRQIIYKHLTPLPHGSPETSVDFPHFRLSRVINRIGESIVFTYTDGKMPSYEATWTRDGSPCGASIRVAYTTEKATAGSANIAIAYTGTSEANPTYSLVVRNVPYPFGQAGSGLMDDAWTRLAPVSLTQDFSRERIQWNYIKGEGVGYGNTLTAPKVIDSIKFPGRTLSLTWRPFKYVRNKTPQVSTTLNPDNIAWAYGVTKVTEQALSGGNPDGPPRITSHSLTVPLRAESAGPGAKPGTWGINWAQTTFKNVIHRPDGIVVVNTYAGPADNPPPTPKLLGGLLFLKHALVEERHYTQGQYIENETAPAESSAAFKRTRYSEWEIRCVSNPTGNASGSSLPYPTIVESWESNSGATVYKKKTHSDWDTATFCWNTLEENVSLNGLPQAVQVTKRTYNTDNTRWFIGRLSREQKTIKSDSTGSMAASVTFPKVLPATLNAFDENLGVVISSGIGDSTDPLKLSTEFTYGTNGVERLLPGAITLKGNGLQSGLVGIGAPGGGPGYLYDAQGHLRSIQQKGASWAVEQTSDLLGRVKTQTDANGCQVTYGYDAAGRLQSIQPSGEQGATIEYNPDHRGVKVRRGAQVMEYRYNGFGELILERRTNGLMTSYRMYGYNTKGQRQWETVWISEREGTANEGAWSMDTPPKTATTIKYDDRGRACLTINANGEKTETSYPGLSTTKKIWARVKGSAAATALMTTCTHDALGRLVKVVDSKGQTTTFAYDPVGKVLESRQIDPVTGVTQQRAWAYDHLGRNVILDQPESGVTYYTGFTVNGKATKAVYGLPRSWRPSNINAEDASAASVGGAKRVISIFDLLGRPITIDGPGVSQRFEYDNKTAAEKSNGKIRRAIDGAIALDYTYGGLNGRLSRLDTSVPGLTAPMTQTFAYDSYGNRVKAATPNGSTDLTINPATGLAKTVKWNLSTLVATPTWDEASWQPLCLFFGNSASTNFGYRPDQTSLMTLNHLEAGNGKKLDWIFQYDEAGRLLQNGEDYYHYDELGRLWKATVARLNGAGAVIQNFDYDAFGNAVSSVATGTLPPDAAPGFNINNFTFNMTERSAMAQGNRLPTTASGIPTGAQYDAQGNLVAVQKMAGATGGTLTMTYDALGRVTSMIDGKRQAKETYQYTAEGLRTVIQEFTGRGLSKTRVNLYNDARQMVSQYTLASGTLAWQRDIVYLGARELAEFDAAGMHITHTDHLGSPRMMTNAAGKSEGFQKYLPFGETLDQTGFKAGKGFTNHEPTDASGLIYMQGRFYAPQWHRFLSPDPARDQHFEQTQSWNIYSYVQNLPTMQIDPTGMILEEGERINRCIETIDEPGRVNVHGGYYLALTELSEKLSQTERNPMSSVQILGQSVSLSYVNLSQEKALAVSDRIAQVVTRINAPPEGLNETEITAIKSIKLLTFNPRRDTAKDSLGGSIFNMKPDYVLGNSPAWVASAIAHDGFHTLQAKRGEVYAPREHAKKLEREANVFQLGVGIKLGFSQREIDHLFSKIVEPHSGYDRAPY